MSEAHTSIQGATRLYAPLALMLRLPLLDERVQPLCHLPDRLVLVAFCAVCMDYRLSPKGGR